MSAVRRIGGMRVIESDPTKRFSDRVANYATYRPGYPDSLVGFLVENGTRGPGKVVADIGSGTGILTGPLLHKGLKVYAIEPNGEMREQAEKELSSLEGFVSIDGQASKTGLADASVDIVTVGQAFHWFDGQAAVIEFLRILRGGGWVALIWNDRKTDVSKFHRGYNDLLLNRCPEYRAATHKNYSAERIAEIFDGWELETAVFPNYQDLDFEGLRGRLESSSYCPLPGDPGHTEIMKELEELFVRSESSGKVRFEYSTQLFLLRPPSADQ
jgi:ubiquinone/menaquinone biosynthesis C-methylase UbiE